MNKIRTVKGLAGMLGEFFLLRRNRLPFVLFMAMAFVPLTTAQQNPKNVLVLSGGPGRASIEQMESSLRSHLSSPVNFSVVDLQNTRLEDEAYDERTVDALRATYSREKPDLIVTVMGSSLRFAMRYRDKMFPTVPIVYMSVNTPLLVDQTWPGVTGVQSSPGITETVDLALHLHPDATSIAVIAGEGEGERIFFSAMHSELLRRQDKVREIDLVGPADGRMLERIAALPPHTVVLFQSLPNYANQPAIGVSDLITAAAQRMPTYSVFPELVMNWGGIGGAVYDKTIDPVVAGELAARVLSGENPDRLPVVHLQVRVEADWRALQRWHIPESALPPGTVILFREPTLWERGRKYFLIAIAVIFLQGLLIFGLLWQRARKRKAEAVLRESETRFRVMADTTPALIWMCDEEGKVTYLNDQRVTFTGPGPGAAFADAWAASVHPDDLGNVQGSLARAVKDHRRFSMEYRLCRYDGVYRWVFDVAAPRVNGDGSFAGFIGSAVDMTDQKLAQKALQKVSGQLIEAQEKERRRIAPEQQYDIAHKMAQLAIEIKQANGSWDRTDTATKERLGEIREHCFGIAKDVQSLSHQLHSSKLEYLGLADAMRGFCRELAKQHKLTIDFQDENLPANLPSEVSLCLFRIAQEALHNSVKYSGTTRFAVKLRATSDEIQLVVSDAGAGFNLEEAKGKGGLGLVSMQERINLVGGRFNIASQPGQGTIIVATVPIAADVWGAAGAQGNRLARVLGAA